MEKNGTIYQSELKKLIELTEQAKEIGKQASEAKSKIQQKFEAGFNVEKGRRSLAWKVNGFSVAWKAIAELINPEKAKELAEERKTQKACSMVVSVNR